SGIDVLETLPLYAILEASSIEHRQHRDPEAGRDGQSETLPDVTLCEPIERCNLVLLLHERASGQCLHLFRDAYDVDALWHDAPPEEHARGGGPGAAVRLEYLHEGSPEVVDLAAQPRNPLLLSGHVEHRD